MNIDEAIMRCKTQRKCSRDVKFPYLFVVEIQTWISCPQNRAWPQMISILSCGLAVYFKGLEWKCLDWTLSQSGECGALQVGDSDEGSWCSQGSMTFRGISCLCLCLYGRRAPIIHRSFLCMEATFTMPWQHSGRHSIVRFHQSEHSISRDLNQ